MEVIQVESAEVMVTAVTAVLNRIPVVRPKEATVIALSGELGAGKTTFVQALAHSLGIVDTVTSPTYVVMKSYALEAGSLPQHLSGFTKLIHIDAYRIEALDEMRVLGFSELLKENDTMICIEWPEHIAALLPENSIKVAISIKDSGREVTITHL